MLDKAAFNQGFHRRHGQKPMLVLRSRRSTNTQRSERPMAVLSNHSSKCARFIRPIGAAVLILLVGAIFPLGGVSLMARGPDQSQGMNAVRESVTEFQSDRIPLVPGPIELRPEDRRAGQMGRWQYIGASSCAAANCHGGSTREQPRYRSSYSVWVQRDRHANAYLVLFADQSRRICRRLGFEPEDSEKLSRCLDCHTVPDHGSGRRSSFTQEDGVSCEACHGPASGWVAEHSRSTWKTLTGEEKQKFGMTDIAGDLAIRGRVCVDCHVGSDRRDVNHDLIAAGHPRLTFELAAYHGMIPAHWDEGKDRRQIEDNLGGSGRASFDVQLWAVGQFVTAKAAVSLLEARASDAAATTAKESSRSNEPSPRARTWPELTEYDCYTCHHSLVPDSWRQSRERLDFVPPRHAGQPGSPRLNSWYFSGLKPICDELDRDQKSTLPRSLATLAETMSTPTWSAQSAEKVKQAARALGASLDEEMARQIHRDRRMFENQPQSLRQLLGRVTAPPGGNVLAEWNDAAQAYLAARAIESGLLDVGQASPQTSREMDEKLVTIARLLAFPTGLNSPRDNDWGQLPSNHAESAAELLRSLGQPAK
jgi:Cytochrome c554 and c-prime